MKVELKKRNNLSLEKVWSNKIEDWAWRVKQHELFKHDEKAMRVIDEIVEKMNESEAFKEILL